MVLGGKSRTRKGFRPRVVPGRVLSRPGAAGVPAAVGRGETASRNVGGETAGRGLPRLGRLAFLVVFVYLFTGLVLQSVEAMGLARQARDLEQRVAALTEENERLAAEIEYAKTDEYIERIAREELGLTRPNEIPYSTAGASTGP
jgi:cell division protein FtsL